MRSLTLCCNLEQRGKRMMSNADSSCATPEARASVAMTIAGSDSGGGAGIQADLKTFSALGVYGTSAITALTAQNTSAVNAIHDVPPDFIVDQIETVLEDISVDAIKIGMLSTVPVIEAIAGVLKRHTSIPVVLEISSMRMAR